MYLHRLSLCLILTTMTRQASHEELVEFGSTLFFLYVLISTALSVFAGICSGLTVGYMAISKREMELKTQSDDPEERKVGEPILKLLNNRHLLLSTLLLSNALALEALPIFLDKIAPGFIAVIISVVAVVVLGEVIPQAYCTGPMKVSIGYYFTGFVNILQLVLCPFVRPITYVLDNWLGHSEEKIELTRENLKNILYLHNSREYGYRKEEI